MASDSINKQEFRIRDLGTRSVLLFPTRAQIIRDIKDITLKPGQNQIIIDGLAPTVDEHSIKVEGTGAATISEVSVDLLPNRDVYEDVYPSDSEEEEDDDEDESESEDEVESLKAIGKKIKQLHLDLLAEKEKINSAANRLQICDNYGKSIATERPSPAELPDVLKAYNDSREQIFNDHTASTAAAEKIQKEIEKAGKEEMKLAKESDKAKEKARKEKAKAREKKLRKKAELLKEKQRIKTERDSFWAKKVYRITISLESSSTMTPGSSRRSSVTESEVVNLASTTFHEPESLKAGSISLSLSYITYSASWSPRYDLSLNSLKCTGTLEYGAELRNTTSETWRDARVILSTSQTTFSGLNHQIPILHPWHVRLMKGGRNNDGALMSQYELEMKRKEWNENAIQPQKPRQEIFGVEKGGVIGHQQARHRLQANNYQGGDGFGATNISSQYQQSAAFGSVVAQSNAQPAAFPSVGGNGGSIFGSLTARAMPPPAPTVVHKPWNDEKKRSGSAAEYEESDYEEGESAETVTRGQDINSLVFEEGAWEESGMTTTYDVPGLKTLVPSNSTIKHKIAKIDFKNIIFSHIVIGKLRQVAFLKARLRNSSKITLLKGPLGLTLDGSFLGQASFPRCSPGEVFSLPLGVDPAIQISYIKPTVRRSQSGIFSKEDSNVFTRTITITNTKHNAAVELTILDQVPVSEDERLKIEVTNPKGLKPGAEAVRTGISTTSALISATTASGSSLKGGAQTARTSVYGTENGKEVAKERKWGSAEATAKKGGEIAWNVKLSPGCGVKLVLEYEATFPGGETVIGAAAPNSYQPMQVQQKNGLFG